VKAPFETEESSSAFVMEMLCTLDTNARIHEATRG
jgi:hypothetical protein